MTEMLLGERELDVMGVLWEIGSGTVAEVRERLDVSLAYTTVLTILRSLEVKVFVRHEEEGHAHRYFPLVQQKSAQRSALSRLLSQLFDGSPQALLAQRVDDHDVTSAELRQLAQSIGKGQSPRADANARRLASDKRQHRGTKAIFRFPGRRAGDLARWKRSGISDVPS